MESEACSSKDLLNIEDEIPWVTSGLYDAERKECQAVRRKDSFKQERTKNQYRRQSEPIVSKIVEALSPKLMNQNKFTLCSITNNELERISYSHKGIIKQTLMKTKSAESSPQIRRRYISSEECFIVNLYIEAKMFHLGPFPFEIYPKMSVGLLKLKVEKELAIPTSFQKWILNKSLAIDNDLLLLDCDVVPGSPIFLYLDSNFEKSIDLDRLYSLGKISANKITHKHIDVCHNTVRQYPVKTNDPENNERFASGNQSGAHTVIKNSPNKKCDKLVLANFEENRRKKKFPESVLENCSENAVKMKSEKILPPIDATAVPCQKKCPGLIKGPFRPVFTKVKEKESFTLLNNIFSGNIGCSTKTSATDVSSPSLKTKNTSSKCQTSDNLVAKNIFKSQKQMEAMKMQSESNEENSSQTVKEETNIMDQKFSVSKKHGVHDLGKFIQSPGLDNKISILSSKCAQSSILEKVRMKHKIKFRKENDNSCSAGNEQYIQNVVSEDKIIEKSAQPVINVNTSDILSQSNHQAECSSTFHDSSEKIPLELETDKIENNKKIDIVLSNHKEEQRPDLAEISKKDLKAENLTDSSDAQNIETYNTDAFRETEITEICIVNNNDGPSPQIHSGNSESIKNIIDSSSCNIGQDVREEENEKIIKKCPENYQNLLKMEDLNLVRNVVNFTCPVCFEGFESDQGVVLHECLHTFCLDCLARTIDYAEEVLVKCPYRDDEYSCQSYLQQREIKALVSPEIYERYLQRSIITAESLAEKSFHCQTPDCPGWCMFDDNINVFHCPVCFHYNCLNCRTIHEGLNCRQYQDKLQSQKKLDPDSEKTLEFLNKMIEAGKALRCPKCDLILMKKWGCDWLKCAVCLTEICWITKGPRWGPGGQGDTSGGCRCGVNGIKCHPACTYCH